jgi:hypothetical protein
VLWKTENCLPPPQGMREEKSREKKIYFFGIEKNISKKKVNFFIAYYKSEYFLLFHFKKVSSLAHWEVPQYASECHAQYFCRARKTLAAHCSPLYTCFTYL